MSQSVDALWKSVVKLLQQLPAQGPEQQCEAFPTIDRQINVLFNKESLPRATWKHLIRELKVCLWLCCWVMTMPGTQCVANDKEAITSNTETNPKCLTLVHKGQLTINKGQQQWKHPMGQAIKLTGKPCFITKDFLHENLGGCCVSHVLEVCTGASTTTAGGFVEVHSHCHNVQRCSATWPLQATEKGMGWRGRVCPSIP